MFKGNGFIHFVGLSPRGRGNRIGKSTNYVATGSIPAWAGEPISGGGLRAEHWVYPRVGGGTVGKEKIPPYVIGLSPRGRGNRARRHLGCGNQGSIPAWAGEPSPRSYSPCPARVYPRVGGGTQGPVRLLQRVCGLSPRGRGNPHLANTGRHILSPPSLVVLNQVHPVGVDYLFRRFAQRPYLLFGYRGGVAPRHHD